MAGIDKLIINSAFREPEHHWKYNLNKQTFEKEPGRRPAGYFVAGQGSNAYNDIGQFIELPLVNMIRIRVAAWRSAGYPGVTGVTKKLLDHWNDKDARTYQFFWCQMDAIETLIWLVEAPAADRVGITIPGDGGLFQRICTKLCTGGGKTTVMAMLIAWQVCNKTTYPQDKRFSKNVFIVAPGLTVKSRLQVLMTGGDNNYYSQFNVVPVGLMPRLHEGKVIINNWQSLAWDSEESLAKKKNVDKRGAKSDEAYAREVLSEMANARNILVINDEAHHAWRKNPEIKVSGKEAKEAAEEATIWISGLDRIHKARGILTCYDFSATPFAPSGKKNDEEALFSWIVSDFGLNDGIESGLVKTPRVVVRDDGTPDAVTFRSKLYHIYVDETVREDINRSAQPEEPLPDLLTQAYYLLGKDWLETYKEWQNQGQTIPPVMITVANRTETAARITYAFDHKRIPVDELCVPELTVHIDSKTMDEAESVVVEDIPSGSEDDGDGEEGLGGRKLSKKEAAAILRDTVDTVGQRGKRGEQIRNVISVGMLSEGWDAKTVTHILGLRAFSTEGSLTALGFGFDDAGTCGVYEEREPHYKSVAIARPEWGEFPDDWNIEFMDTDINGYSLRIIYHASEGKYQISLEKDGVGCSYQSYPAIDDKGWEEPDLDTVHRMFNDAFGTKEKELYYAPLEYFEKYVQEHFDMSVDELYAAPKQ